MDDSISLIEKVKKYQQKEKEYHLLLNKEKQKLELLNISLLKEKNILSKLSNLEYDIEIKKLSGKIIDTDKVIGSWSLDKSKHRCLDVECIYCNTKRKVPSTVFFNNRPLKSYKCKCQSYLPVPDYTYLNTIRGYDIFIGMGNREKGHQKIWVKCLKCNQYRSVDGLDYLNNRCILECKHLIKEPENMLNLSDFNKINTFYSPNDFYTGLDLGEDIFIKFEKKNGGETFAFIQCKDCGRIRKISYSEFLRANGHTLAYRKCDCKGSFDIVLNGIYGNLKVLGFDKQRKLYKCQCLCEDKSIVYRDKYKLQNGISCSCGCLSRNLKGIYNQEKFRNQIFGNLQVMGFYKLKKDSKIKNSKRIYWGCNCLRCGSYSLLESKLVKKGAITNCGCKNNRFMNEYKIGDFIDDLELLDIIKIKGVGTYWNVKCPFCGTPFVRLASNIVLGHYKSCGCLQRSYGELLVLSILKELNLKYEEQKSFKDLKNGVLRFDFEVIKDNKIYLIEFDGMQHYSENSQFIRNKKIQKSNYKKLNYNDNLKNEYCLKHNIPLLRIVYTTNKEKIKKQIKEFLGG